MNGKLISKNVTINGRRTSLRLERAIWDAIGDICDKEGLTHHELITFIDHRRNKISRTSAVRTFTVTYLHDLATEKGRLRKGTVLSILPPLAVRLKTNQH